jgi:RNA polymerase sigma factor (sigma-70 family)
MDDAALVHAARSGDDTAWAAIYDRYADKLYDHCNRILRDRDEAADALHDGFLAASRNLQQLRDPSRLRPWLYSICRHTSLRRLKARDRVDLTDSPDDLMGTDLDLERGVRAEELSELVWAAAAGLGGRDQALLDLHLRQGLEGQDLADAMGTSLSNSYVMLSRMRDQVERSLGALLVARMGREDCDELNALLAGWDGRFSPLMRKRVARHVDGCEVCSDKRSAMVSPLALLAAAPLVPAPALLKTRVISSIRNIDVVDGPHVPFTKEGFAVLSPDEGPRRVKGAWLAAAAALLLVLGALFAVQQGDDGGSKVLAAGQETTTTHATRSLAPDGSTIPTLAEDTTTSVAVGAPGTDGGDEGPQATTGTTVKGKPGGAGPTTTAKPAPTTTATPKDTAGPTISSPHLSVGECVAGRRSISISVTASDPAGVKSVRLSGPNGGPIGLSDGNGDGTWGGARTTNQGSGPLVIEATDGLGNTTSQTLRDGFAECPQPTTSTTAPTTTSTATSVPG